MPHHKTKTTQLNIYLAKDPSAHDEALIKDVEGLENIELSAGAGTSHNLYFRQLPMNAPKWGSFFGAQSSTLAGLRNTSCGALLIIRRPSATFVLSFGLAHSLLNEDAFEERFGLLAALNSAGADHMRKVDTVSLGSRGRQSSVQVGGLGVFGDFGLNVDSDLVRKVSVKPSDAALGKQLVGRQGLTIGSALGLAGLPALLDRLLGLSRDTAYQVHHGWLDNMFEVRERALIAKLDAAMLVAFVTPDPSVRLWAAVPEVVEWERIESFRYSMAKDAAEFPDLHVAHMRSSFVRKELSALRVDDLKRKAVQAVPPSGHFALYHWSFYRCLYCELQHDGEQFILTNGSWFRVAPDFVMTVTNDLRPLAAAAGFQLPDYLDASEKVYNQRVVAATPGYACMDADNIMHGGGSSRIELCDLISDKKDLIFVKRYGGSDSLSHLFQQGAVSANLMAVDATFRAKVNQKLPPTHRLVEQHGRFDPALYRLIYAITTRKAQPILDSLPFFSKVSLRNASNLLRGFGYKVEVVGIKDTRATPSAEGTDED